MTQEENKKVEVDYERIQKLAHGLQVPTTESFLTIVFRVDLQSYLRIVTTGMKQSTLQQHKEATMLCEEGMSTIKSRSALLVPQITKQTVLAKTQSNTGKTKKHCINYWMTNHNVETCRKKKE